VRTREAIIDQHVALTLTRTCVFGDGTRQATNRAYLTSPSYQYHSNRRPGMSTRLVGPLSVCLFHSCRDPSYMLLSSRALDVTSIVPTNMSLRP
jgi:hypothetical protein